MATAGLLTMSLQELNRAQLMQRLQERRSTQRQAAAILGISLRQVERDRPRRRRRGAASAWATVASLFTGLGMGAKVLQLGITRSFLFTIPAALLAGWVFDLGPAGVWAAVVIGSAATSVQALIAARNLIRSAG